MSLYQTLRRYPLQSTLCMAVVIFLLSAALAYQHTMSSFETAIFRSINDLPANLGPLMLAITELGSIVIVGGLIAAAVIAGWWRLALVFIGAIGAVQVISTAAKIVVGRERPEYVLQAVNLYGPVESAMGFPSGHTATATVLALVIASQLPAKWRWFVVVWVGAVAISRVYLGVHAPLDIVGGICVGTIIYCVARLVTGKWWKTLMN